MQLPQNEVWRGIRRLEQFEDITHPRFSSKSSPTCTAKEKHGVRESSAKVFFLAKMAFSRWKNLEQPSYIYLYMHTYSYVYVSKYTYIYIYISTLLFFQGIMGFNGGSNSPPQLLGGMCGNSDLSTAETVPFPSLKPTVRPLKQAGTQKDRLPTIHFQGWNQLGWRLFWWIHGWEMGFTFLIETLRKRCEDNIISVGWFGTFEVCARCFLESWFWAGQATNLDFMSGQRCGCLEFRFFGQQSVHGVMIGWKISSDV